MSDELAARIRTSTARTPWRVSTVPSCKKRSRFNCWLLGKVKISFSSSVPPSACSKKG
ncbi:Uncharacterised protein [Vibrio cholerae]|nr:Uncharacterised protein [Vibrio cholerae]